METIDLVDIWQNRHPNKKRFTWHSNDKLPICCRLDVVLVSESLNNIIKQCAIKSSYKSDHSTVSLTLDTNKLERGPGYFKINNSVLTEESYHRQIKTGIRDIVSLNENANPNTLCPNFKGTIRNITIQFTTEMKKKGNENKKL